MNQPPQQPPGYPPAPPQAYPAQGPMHGGPPVPPQPVGSTAPSPTVGGYEFTEEENKTVERAAAWAKGLGFIMFLECGLQIINLNVLGLILYVVLGVLFWRGGQALTNVVETEGNDVAHLMEALEKLGQALMIRIVVVSIVAVALFLIGAIAAIMTLG